jgi:hypothetical protein
VLCGRFHTENSEILGASVQNLVSLATWRPGFVQHWHSVSAVLEEEKEEEGDKNYLISVVTAEVKAIGLVFQRLHKK